jgi:fructosamine-3-kinase
MDKPVKNKLEEILGEEARVTSGVGGGSIADSNIIETSSGKRFFLKTGFSSSMFINEANGLKELRKPGCIKIPEVIAADRDFLLLELVTPGPRIKISGKCLAVSLLKCTSSLPVHTVFTKTIISGPHLR